MRTSTRTVLVGAAALPLALLTPALAFADEAPAAGPLDAVTSAVPAPVADALGTAVAALPAVPSLPVPLPVDANAVAGTVLGALPLPAAPAADDATDAADSADDSADSAS